MMDKWNGGPAVNPERFFKIHKNSGSYLDIKKPGPKGPGYFITTKSLQTP